MDKKKFAKTALAVMGGAFVLGLILVFGSGKFGDVAGQKALASNGGAMGTNAYNRVVDTATANVRVGGGILAVVGGMGTILCGYVFYKEI